MATHIYRCVACGAELERQFLITQEPAAYIVKAHDDKRSEIIKKCRNTLLKRVWQVPAINFGHPRRDDPGRSEEFMFKNL